MNGKSTHMQSVNMNCLSCQSTNRTECESNMCVFSNDEGKRRRRRRNGTTIQRYIQNIHKKTSFFFEMVCMKTRNELNWKCIRTNGKTEQVWQGKRTLDALASSWRIPHAQHRHFSIFGIFSLSFFVLVVVAAVLPSSLRFFYSSLGRSSILFSCFRIYLSISFLSFFMLLL